MSKFGEEEDAKKEANFDWMPAGCTPLAGNIVKYKQKPT